MIEQNRERIRDLLRTVADLMRQVDAERQAARPQPECTFSDIRHRYREHIRPAYTRENNTMKPIRNADEYRSALNRLKDLEVCMDLNPTNATNGKVMNEIFALAEAVDAYELSHAEPMTFTRK